MDDLEWVSNTAKDPKVHHYQPRPGQPLEEAARDYWEWRRRFVEGPPQGREGCSAAVLERMGMIGLYRRKGAGRRGGEMREVTGHCEFCGREVINCSAYSVARDVLAAMRGQTPARIRQICGHCEIRYSSDVGDGSWRAKLEALPAMPPTERTVLYPRPAAAL